MRSAFGLLLTAVVLTGPAGAQEDAVVQPSADWVEFDGQRLYFACAGRNPGESFREYIPAGESLQSWTKLASVREYSNVGDPLQFARSMAQLAKAQNPDSQAAIVRHPKNGDVVLDFITWPTDASFVEFNVFRIQKQGAKGIKAHQYAVRAYGNKREFMLGLTDFRRRMQEEMVIRGMTTSPPATARR